MLKDVIRNAIHIGIMRLSTPVVMIAVLPALSRLLGPAGLGRFIFCMSVAVVIISVVDWGFVLSGPRKVARGIDRNKVYADYTTGRFLLWCGAMVVAAAFLPLLKQKEGFGVMLSALGGLGRVFSADYILIGLERTQGISVSAIIGRWTGAGLSLCAAGLGWGDVAAVGGFSIGRLVEAMVMTRYLRGQGVEIKFGKVKDGFTALREAASLFAGRVFISIYAGGGSLFLRGFGGSEISVAYFGVGERVLRVAGTAFGPLAQAAYPRATRLEKQNFKRFATRTGFLLVAAGIVAAIFIWIAAKPIALFLGGEKLLPAAEPIRIMAPTVALIAASNFCGLVLMLPLGMRRAFVMSVACGAVVSVLLMAVLVPNRQHIGAATAVLAAEATVLVAQTIGIFRRRRSINGD